MFRRAQQTERVLLTLVKPCAHWECCFPPGDRATAHRKRKGKHMITINRGLVAGVVLAGAALGLASPASAGPPSGSYLGTVTEARGEGAQVGGTLTLALNPCGPDCVTIGATKLQT